MAGKTNYDFERRERDRAKQAKKEAKAREKASADSASAGNQPANPTETTPDLPRPTE